MDTVQEGFINLVTKLRFDRSFLPAPSVERYFDNPVNIEISTRGSLITTCYEFFILGAQDRRTEEKVKENHVRMVEIASEALSKVSKTSVEHFKETDEDGNEIEGTTGLRSRYYCIWVDRVLHESDPTKNIWLPKDADVVEGNWFIRVCIMHFENTMISSKFSPSSFTVNDLLKFAS